jgi:glycosyltransferase involved in cell wall biosynthesis
VLTMVDGIGTYGGGESLARRVAQRLDPERFESIFCVTRWEPLEEYEPALEQLREAGVEFIGLARHRRLDFGEWGRLVREIREREVDVLHSHKFGSNLWAALIAMRARPRVFIAHEHSWEFEGRPWRRQLDRRLIAARADAYVVVSRADEQSAIDFVGVPASKVRRLQNGIPALPEPAAPLDLEGLGRGPVIGTVATLRPVKNLPMLIRAASVLSDEFPGVRVLIAGGRATANATDARELQALVSELGLEQCVVFLGLRPDIERVLASIEVAVLTSRREGSPLSVMEYMAAGLPVVATRVGGVPDIVADGETGILVPPDDEAGLAEAIARLLRDPQLARSMGEAGRRRQRVEFTIEATVGRVEALYEELWAAKAARS